MTSDIDSTQRFLIPAMSRSVVPFLDRLGQVFFDRGHDIAFFPQNHITEATARRQGRLSAHYDPGIVNHKPANSLEALTEKYHIASPRSLVFPQMNYEYKNSDPPDVDYPGPGARYAPPSAFSDPEPYDPYINWAHRCLDFFDQLFEAGDGGIPVHYQGAEIIRRVLQRVADYHDSPSVWIGFSPVPDHSGFFVDESSHWPTIAESDYDELTEEERARAREYIGSVRQDKPTVYGGWDVPSASQSTYSKLKERVDLLREDGLDVLPAARERLKYRAKRTLLGAYATRKYHDIEESRTIIENEQYVFFPLQYYIESRVTMRAPAFYEQAWLVEYLSRSVPTNHELVVKDHPKQLGAQSLAAVSTMARHAVPVAPVLDAHDVVLKSSAVITLNNTVGYEALIHGTPVVTLGDAIYDDYTVTVKNINDLDEAIDRAIRRGGPSENEIIEFVHGLLEGSKRGLWRDESDENVENLVDGVLETVARQRSP